MSTRLRLISGGRGRRTTSDTMRWRRLASVSAIALSAGLLASCTTSGKSSLLSWSSGDKASAELRKGRVKVVKAEGAEDRVVAGYSPRPGAKLATASGARPDERKDAAASTVRETTLKRPETKVVEGTGSRKTQLAAADTSKAVKKPYRVKEKLLAQAGDLSVAKPVPRDKVYTSGSVMSLRAAVLRASKMHPSVRAAWSRHASSRARSRVERGALFPTVGVSASTGPQYYKSGSTIGTRRGRTLWRSEATLVATQLIYDGWQSWNRYKQAQSSITTARFRVANAKQEVALAAVAAYVDVLRNRQLVRIARRNVGVHRSIVGGVSQLTNQGRADRADVSQASSRLALAQSNLELRVGQLRDAEARFASVLGHSPRHLAKVRMPSGLKRVSVRNSLGVAQKRNPLIGVAKGEVKSRRHGVKATDGLFTPRLEVELSGRTGENLDGTRGRTDDLRALLKLTWNLYRGGADIARRNEAVANLAAARHDEAEARRLVRERVLRSYAILSSNSRRLIPLRRRLSASRGVVGAYSEQFRLGRRSLLDRLDAQNELFIAHAELVDVRYTVLFNYYSLLAATGELLNAFNVKP